MSHQTLLRIGPRILHRPAPPCLVPNVVFGLGESPRPCATPWRLGRRNSSVGVRETLRQSSNLPSHAAKPGRAPCAGPRPPPTMRAAASSKSRSMEAHACAELSKSHTPPERRHTHGFSFSEPNRRSRLIWSPTVSLQPKRRSLPPDLVAKNVGRAASLSTAERPNCAVASTSLRHRRGCRAAAFSCTLKARRNMLAQASADAWPAVRSGMAKRGGACNELAGNTMCQHVPIQSGSPLKRSSRLPRY